MVNRPTQHKAFSLTSNSYKIYNCLLYFYNDDLGYAYPTIQQIMDETGICKRQVYASLNEIEDAGLIVRKKNPNKDWNTNNIYIVNEIFA